MHPASIIDPQGPAADTAAGLWWLMLALGGAVIVAVVVILAVGVRRSNDVDGASGDSSRFWILGWGVALPVIVVGVVLVATIAAMRSTTADADADALRIEVTGHQWWWEVDYVGLDIVTANEVHIPAGEPVAIDLRSADVIHSFWVPALAGKLDALPERTNTLVIQADEPGRFAGRCAEFCGLQHANMDFTVVAHSASDFAEWMEREQRPARQPTTDLERTGFDIATHDRCASCHRIDGSDADGDRGPDLTHVGSRIALVGGLLDVSRVDLVAWITDPHGVKPGASMPDVDLTVDEVEAVAAYLESLM